MPLWFDLMMAQSGAGAGTTAILIGNAGKIATTVDGLTWTAGTSGFGTSAILGVAEQGTDAFIFGVAGKLFHSTDYVTWAAGTSGQTVELKAGAASGSKVVIGGDLGKLITASSPGGTFTLNSSTGFGTRTVHSIATDGTIWALVADDRIYYTSDPAGTWTYSGQANALKIAYAFGKWVGIFNSSLKSATTPGGTWTTRQSFGSVASCSLSLANGVLFAHIQKTGASNLFISSDGLAWTVGTAPDTAENLSYYAFLSGLFLAGCETGAAYSSPDYTTWTARTSTFGSTQINGILSL